MQCNQARPNSKISYGFFFLFFLNFMSTNRREEGEGALGKSSNLVFNWPPIDFFCSYSGQSVLYENLSSQQFFSRHCSFFFFLMSDVLKFIRLLISFPPPLLLTWIRFSSSSSSLESYAHTAQRYAAVQNRCFFNSFPGNVMFSRAPSSTNLNSARRNEKRKRERKKRNCVCACELRILAGYRYTYQIAREIWIQR